MSETQNPKPDQNPEEGTDRSVLPRAPDAKTPDDAGTAAPSPAAAEPEPPSAEPEPLNPGASPLRGGHRVTRRRVNRREVIEDTVETITEDIPLEAFQGPESTHPAPVG